MLQKTISKNDIRPGDVLIFSAKDDFISKSIAILTNSDVSHASLADYDITKMLESTTPQARTTDIPFTSGITIYVRRLDKSLIMNPVVDYMTEYVNNSEPYPYADLIFIGIYILIKDYTKTLAHYELICTIVKMVCFALEELINNKYHPGKQPMVCSQLVYFAYNKAAINYNKDYKIHIESENRTYKSILDLVLDYLNLAKSPDYIQTMNTNLGEPYTSATFPDMESVCKELVTLLSDSDSLYGASPVQLTDSHNILIQYVIKFCQLLLKSTGIHISNPDNTKAVVQKVLDLEAAFISPADLCYHTTNLLDLGHVR